MLATKSLQSLAKILDISSSLPTFLREKNCFSAVHTAPNIWPLPTSLKQVLVSDLNERAVCDSKKHNEGRGGRTTYFTISSFPLAAMQGGMGVAILAQSAVEME